MTDQPGYRLNVVPIKGASYQVPVDGELLIGRDRACDLCLDHKTVSTNHALVTVKGSSVAIKDLNSTNGTLIGGTPIAGEHWLRDHAVFEIGAFQLELIPPRREPDTKTAPLKTRAAKLDERDKGVITALLAEWSDPGVQVPTVRGAEELAGDLHCSRQEVNRRVARLEAKLDLPKGLRGQKRYHRLAEELLRRGLGPAPS
jgi:pSer/pThr/pTyr-binding forkhead associated (FHA) protein